MKDQSVCSVCSDADIDMDFITYDSLHHVSSHIKGWMSGRFQCLLDSFGPAVVYCEDCELLCFHQSFRVSQGFCTPK
ncbi:hypothetical protein Y032_0004g2149 [Ancylostoma ceylanicum]|uniref:Uncharacterized protein n=1 Tax=Ancylostoma ceylanicum TaxID=53326 RepID=A0A016VVT4_9BILA|nr:hypothetical protein Y032_0004g2149 [Ancylostoma ceylanicum]